MKIRICSVVTGNTMNEFLHNLRENQKISDLVELRVGYIQNLKLKDITLIKKITKRPAIFTCRKKQEGGNFNRTENERTAIFEKAYKLNFEFIDIELSSINHFNVLKHHNKKFILSYHDFNETPNENVLLSLITQMQRYKPFAVKIATQVNHTTDIIRLCKLIVNKNMDEKRIIIGMGNKGRMIRVIAPLIGGYLTYAVMDKENALHGQFTLTELQSIYKLIQLTS